MAKKASWVFGVIFVVAGVWGFFTQPAVGFIAADNVSSIIHIVAGLLLLVMAGKPSAGMVLKVVGAIYVIWGLLGMFEWNFTVEDSTTNWFYLIVGVVLAVIGFMNKSSVVAPPAQPQM